MELTNERCELMFDENRRLVAVKDTQTGEAYAVADGAEYVVFDGAITNEGIEVGWTDRGGYFEKTVTFTAPADGVLDSVCVFDASFPDAAQVHFHDDKTIWHCPMCVFARHEHGGVYYGLEYPYWDDETEMTFSPWLPMKKGERFVSESVFVGVYRKTGESVSSHGPYPGERKQKYADMFIPEKTGLCQDFPDSKIPEVVDIPEETLDRGEIRAMRDFFRSYLGRTPLPEDGYFVWQNAWWGGFFNSDTGAVDALLRAGVHDLMTAVMYYGHANHPSTEPKYITEALADPLRFPKVTSDADKVAHKEGELHQSVTSGAAEGEIEYTEGFSAPLDYDAMIKYGKERGFHVASFSTPNNAYRNYPEWIALKSDGTPHDYFGTRLSCSACRAFIEHHLNVMSAIFDKYHPRIWPFDGRFMGYREIDYGERIGERPCFAEGHGHLPGKSRYIEWKNIEEFKRRLKEKYPEVVLEHYYGMKRGSTWSLKYCNSDENYFECSCADDNRFQTWHNENDRFRPTYMNYAPIFGKEHDFAYSLISAISTSEYAQLASGYYDLRDRPECLEFFKKWRAWAGENHRYLLDREFLFGCPGDVPIDASAHIIDGEGWVFLFNTVGFDAEARLVPSDIPGLADCGYEARVIYPTEALVAEEDGAITVPVASHTACVLWLGKRG